MILSNGILSTLANTFCRASPDTLRTTAPALCCSVAEYACPACSHSLHAAKVDSGPAGASLVAYIRRLVASLVAYWLHHWLRTGCVHQHPSASFRKNHN